MELKAFTIILRFLTLRIQQNYCFKNINLKEINLRNSGIDSIEHITMNPGHELYLEYYSDYDIPDSEYDYDHIGDIRDLVSCHQKSIWWYFIFY